MLAKANLEIRKNLKEAYSDVYTTKALEALAALAPLDRDCREVMAARIERRRRRFENRERIGFLDPAVTIPRTSMTVQNARNGEFAGSEIPDDLKRQWIQGTGPGTKPRSSVESGIRNVAHALLSGADGWMFDGEDALGQTEAMSLDNQRNLKLAIDRDELFLKVAEQVAGEMNEWARGFFGRTIVTTGAASSTSRPRSFASAACISTTAMFTTRMARDFRRRSPTWCCTS
jgi:malate synthase